MIFPRACAQHPARVIPFSTPALYFECSAEPSTVRLRRLEPPHRAKEDSRNTARMASTMARNPDRTLALDELLASGAKPGSIRNYRLLTVN